MPSPFPGMDPYIEGQKWHGFHAALIAELQAALVPLVRPRYVVEIEETVYIEAPVNGSSRITPDVSIVKLPRSSSTSTGVVAVAPPVEIHLPIPSRIRQGHLEIRLRETGEVITVLELLSPSNKRRGSEGRREYLRKRDSVLVSGAHLVELDLLRGGERMPTEEPLPPADYYALISRAHRRPTAEVWPFGLRDPLPRVPIPLSGDDADVELDLQAVFTAVYDRAGYDYSLDYAREPEPPLAPEEVEWAAVAIGTRDG